jgi:hypothetical protein
MQYTLLSAMSNHGARLEFSTAVGNNAKVRGSGSGLDHLLRAIDL